MQCFKRVRLSATAWGRLRHLDARDSLADERPTATATPVRKEPETKQPEPVRPVTGTEMFAPPYRIIGSTAVQQQPQPLQLVNQLPPTFGRGMGRGAMLLHLLNQQRATQPGVTYPPPRAGYGRGFMLNPPPSFRPTTVAAPSAALGSAAAAEIATMQIPSPPLHSPGQPQQQQQDQLESWEDDDSDIIIL